MGASSRLGIDTGGTFTDFVWLDEQSRLHIHKQLSTPHDPVQAIMAGVEHLNIPASASVIHGSTVATNAVLERRGARTALITTAGFADVLAIGRQNRPELYALVPHKAKPLVPRAWRFEVRERVTADGKVLMPLDLADLQPILAKIADDRLESVAVCFLFSFLRPEHEQRVREAIEQWQADQLPLGNDSSRMIHISLSSEVLPEFREYERTSTTVLNAYVAPLVGRYLKDLERLLDRRSLAVMQSNGGILNAHVAGEQAARTILSGPAGGVVGARFAAGLSGYRRIISFDMGGTSTDVSLCPNYPLISSHGEIDGLPLHLPMIDIHTVGAGGGSMAEIDAAGALRVGPQSAGADPGPACYQGLTSATAGQRRPVTLATTTDANLALGRLDAEHFLGGSMRLSLEAARAVLMPLAMKMGVETVEEAAWGVIQVANAHMERAVRRISVERGYDPRDFTMVAFGGAGPLHACELAESLQIGRVLVPEFPGVLSALGMLVAQPTRDYSRTVMRPATEDEVGIASWLEIQFRDLESQAISDFAAAGYGRTGLLYHRSLDMRYAGQSHEIPVPWDHHTGEESVVDLFHAAHEKRFNYRRPGAPAEIVNLRLQVVAPIREPEIAQSELRQTDALNAAVGNKQVWFQNGLVEAVLYDREKLEPGAIFAGPAVVFQYDATTLVPPGWRAAVDGFGHLILTTIYN